MEFLQIGENIGALLFAGLCAFFGMKTAVKVIEVRIAGLETSWAAHVAAINQRITDLANRVK